MTLLQDPGKIFASLFWESSLPKTHLTHLLNNQAEKRKKNKHNNNNNKKKHSARGYHHEKVGTSSSSFLTRGGEVSPHQAKQRPLSSFLESIWAGNSFLQACALRGFSVRVKRSDRHIASSTSAVNERRERELRAGRVGVSERWGELAGTSSCLSDDVGGRTGGRRQRETPTYLRRREDQAGSSKWLKKAFVTCHGEEDAGDG